MKVALLQMNAGGDPLRKGEQFCRQARALGADIALFPEMWSHGYAIPASPEDLPAWAATAVTEDGPFVQHFARLARELEIAIAITYLQQWPGLPRNAVSLIDRHGEIRM